MDLRDCCYHTGTAENIEASTFKIGQDGSGLLGNQATGRIIPRPERHFIIAGEAPVGKKAEIEGGGSQAANASGGTQHVGEGPADRLGTSSAVIGKSGADDALAETGLIVDPDGTAIAGGTATTDSTIAKAKAGGRDDATDSLLAVKQADRAVPNGNTVCIVTGAIDWIKHPTECITTGSLFGGGTALFGDDAIFRKVLADALDKAFLGSEIGLGQEVEGVDLGRNAEIPTLHVEECLFKIRKDRFDAIQALLYTGSYAVFH